MFVAKTSSYMYRMIIPLLSAILQELDNYLIPATVKLYQEQPSTMTSLRSSAHLELHKHMVWIIHI